MEYFCQRYHEYLNETGPVEVAGFTWESADVFKTMAAGEHGDYEATFAAYVQDQVKRLRNVRPNYPQRSISYFL